MSFKFFRPWEDGGNVSTNHMTDPHCGSQDEASKTTKPLTIYVGLRSQQDQSCFSSGTEATQPQPQEETPAVLSNKTSAEAISIDVNNFRFSLPLMKTPCKVGPLSAKDSSVSQVAFLKPTCGSRIVVDAGNQGVEAGLHTANETSQNRDNIWQSPGKMLDQGRSESLTTPTLTDAIQNSSKQENALYCTPRISCDHSNEFVVSFCPSNFSAENALNIQAILEVNTGAIENLMTAGQSNVERTHRPVNNKESKSGCGSLKGTNSKQNAAASSHVYSKEPHRTLYNRFKCTECQKSFSRSSYLHQHERVHRGSKPFHCRMCGKAFSHASKLHRHERIHTGTKPFQCRICAKAFSQASHLHAHERIHTGSKPFQCKICEKAFSHASNLHRHERIHTESKPFQCRICGKAFSQSSNLHRHEHIHTGSKPFKCRICEKALSRASHLHAHERIHSRSKPFKCRICKKAFSQASKLHSYERIHTRSKAFKCRICEKAFSQATTLQVHERIHTGSKPFKCRICEMVFSHKSKLHAHECIHTGSKHFRCSFCEKAFAQTGYLQKHECTHTS